jgi:hypothetical protein
MENSITIPDINSLYNEEAKQGEQLNALLNCEPKREWIKEHPFIKGYKYIPIDKVEFLLRRIFVNYRIEITGQGTAFNGVWVTVRVHYHNPIINAMSYHDGIGAMIGLLAVGFGMEVSNKDYDVAKLIKTGSFAASQIERDENGDLKQGSIDAFCVAAEKDYNCADFKNQPEAQAVYNRCQGLGQNMDVYHLDGDKDP